MLVGVLAHHAVDPSLVFVDYIAVHPAWRRCGYARQMLGSIDVGVELVVDGENRQAIALYVRAGFTFPRAGHVYEPDIGMRVMRRLPRPECTRKGGRPWQELAAEEQAEVLALARATTPTGVQSLQIADPAVRFHLVHCSYTHDPRTRHSVS